MLRCWVAYLKLRFFQDGLFKWWYEYAENIAH
jgi:hypothetical protein